MVLEGKITSCNQRNMVLGGGGGGGGGGGATEEIYHCVQAHKFQIERRMRPFLEKSKYLLVYTIPILYSRTNRSENTVHTQIRQTAPQDLHCLPLIPSAF